MNDTMLGWHWLAADRRLQFGTHEVVEVGKTYTAEGPLIMCQNGLHACRRALEALRYAPGPIVCRVRLAGEIQHDTDKSVAQHRTELWMADATPILHEFALMCAEDALGRQAALGQEPDVRSWAALEIKRRWLRGDATDQELAAAEAAAGAAAGAAWAAARVAAGDAAWDAARSAAGDAAWAAARSAAKSAAWAAAWDAARAAAEAATEAAAEAAAGDAALAASWDAQHYVLEQMLLTDVLEQMLLTAKKETQQ